MKCAWYTGIDFERKRVETYTGQLLVREWIVCLEVDQER